MLLGIGCGRPWLKVHHATVLSIHVLVQSDKGAFTMLPGVGVVESLYNTPIFSTAARCVLNFVLDTAKIHAEAAAAYLAGQQLPSVLQGCHQHRGLTVMNPETLDQSPNSQCLSIMQKTHMQCVSKQQPALPRCCMSVKGMSIQVAFLHKRCCFGYTPGHTLHECKELVGAGGFRTQRMLLRIRH